jgi:hypothetical protein
LEVATAISDGLLLGNREFHATLHARKMCQRFITTSLMQALAFRKGADRS